MRKVALIVSAAALALGGAAYAAPGMMHGGDTTRAEAQEKAEARFTKMDINKDGQLNAEDRTARMDARFDRLDTDGNGAISRTEFADGHKGMRGHHADRGEGKHHSWKGGKGMGHKQAMGHKRADMMKLADSNGDGGVSSAEFTAARLARFDKADADNDGTITRAERRAAHKEMRTKWREHRGTTPEAAPKPE